jgi:oligogalacturonide lyase
MEMMARRLAQKRKTTVFTVNLTTGEVKTLFTTTDWVDHFQFSPTDPKLMSLAHEGPWWLVDRVWLVHLDAPNPTPMLVHRRTMRMETANHEYWSNDGQWLWYDLETPLNEVFWVAGYNVYTGQRVWYHLTLDQWSIHYNTSPDGTLFSGDGGATDDLGPHPEHSKFIFLFHPSLLADQQPAPADHDLIQVGTFVTEKLVDLSSHSYSLEPNSTFSPDGKWVVFRSNMRGATQVYAVEVKKSDASPPSGPLH